MEALVTAAARRRDPPFKHLGGDPSLNLVNTVDWTAQGLARERLTDYHRLTRWAEGAGILARTHAERLRRTARARPSIAQAALERARHLRAVLQRTYRSLAMSRARGIAWEAFNRELAAALRRLRVGPSRDRRQRRAEWSWHAPEGELDCFLWPVIWSAARLLTSEEAGRIRICAGVDCGWMYVDRSRNRLRRWCAMGTCGTAAKSRRRRERRLKAAARARTRTRFAGPR